MSLMALATVLFAGTKIQTLSDLQVKDSSDYKTSQKVGVVTNGAILEYVEWYADYIHCKVLDGPNAGKDAWFYLPFLTKNADGTYTITHKDGMACVKDSRDNRKVVLFTAKEGYKLEFIAADITWVRIEAPTAGWIFYRGMCKDIVEAAPAPAKAPVKK